MENGLKIKKWAIDTVGVKAWTLVSMRALPELLLCKRKVSLLNIGKLSKFDQEHVDIFNRYFVEVYGVSIPTDISNFYSKVKGNSGFKIDWIDKVTGRMKVSITIVKPVKWFEGLFK